MSVFALQSTRVLRDGRLGPGVVVVDGERIAEVTDHAPAGVPVDDLGSLVVGPGLVDTHVHLNEPGRTDWEGFETATRAAAAGGVTTLVDMPLNCDPVTTSEPALQTKLRSTEGQLAVDVGFWGGVVPGNADDLERLAKAGVLGAKAFLCHSGLDAFPNVDATGLRRAMEILRDAGVPLLVHAELEHPIEGPPGDARAYETYLRSRPDSFEVNAVRLLVDLVRDTRAPTHIVHLSSAKALPLLRAAKDEGLPLTAETCPHYLCLESGEVSDGQTLFKCAPPIRDRQNQDALWDAVGSGLVDFVVTDHSPCTAGLKHLDTGDFSAAWGGICSLQLGLPAIWTRAKERGASPETIFRWMADGPARFARLGEKGRLAKGALADLVAWDPEGSFDVSPDALFVKNKITPYAGRRLHGVVHRTYLRGRVVFDRSLASPFAPTPQGRPLLAHT